tara:strand:+ start:9125 stop:9673 length:549 start_codon:yes stop_codon:yes gene_type:complete
VGGYALFTRQFNQVLTNGIRLEFLGSGWGIVMAGSSPSMEPDSSIENEILTAAAERVNGLSLSLTGTYCDCHVNGASIGTIAQDNQQVNGLSLNLLTNHVYLQNGIQIGSSGWAYQLNGIQVGLFTSSVHINGIQAGGFTHGTFNRGLQFGIVNISNHLKGIQIGLWNINSKRQLPLINWNF